VKKKNNLPVRPGAVKATIAGMNAHSTTDYARDLDELSIILSVIPSKLNDDPTVTERSQVNAIVGLASRRLGYLAACMRGKSE